METPLGILLEIPSKIPIFCKRLFQNFAVNSHGNFFWKFFNIFVESLESYPFGIGNDDRNYFENFFSFDVDFLKLFFFLMKFLRFFSVTVRTRISWKFYFQIGSAVLLEIAIHVLIHLKISSAIPIENFWISKEISEKFTKEWPEELTINM